MGWFSKSSNSAQEEALNPSPPLSETKPTLQSEALALHSDETHQTSNPGTLAATTETSDDANAAAIRASEEAYLQYSHTQRLGLPPYPRIALTLATAGGYGFMSGFYGGFQLGSLKYLALNAHRLPRTKGGWYFYHKRKNYVVLKEALQSGFKTSVKYGVVSAGYMGLEAYLDHVRGKIDALSTVGAALVFGVGYAGYSKFFFFFLKSSFFLLFITKDILVTNTPFKTASARFKW